MIPTAPNDEPIFNVPRPVVVVLAILVLVHVRCARCCPPRTIFGKYSRPRSFPAATARWAGICPEASRRLVHVALYPHAFARRLGAPRAQFGVAFGLRRCIKLPSARELCASTCFSSCADLAALAPSTWPTRSAATHDRRFRRHLRPHGRCFESSVSCTGFRWFSPLARGASLRPANVPRASIDRPSHTRHQCNSGRYKPADHCRFWRRTKRSGNCLGSPSRRLSTRAFYLWSFR